MSIVRNAPQKQTSPLGIEQIFPVLLATSGIDFNLYKLPTIRRAIAKRLHALDMTVAQYTAHLKKNPQEAGDLASSMLICVTGFFRDPEVFRILNKKVFPALIKSDKNPIRIWVPGCCTGEEVYSLAMALTDFLDTKNVSFLIFGTDLSDESLKKARTGIYQKKDLKGLSPQYIQRFFTQTEAGFLVHKNIRSMCTFAKQNLVQDPPFSKLDLISCRNVMIYLKPDMQDKLIRTFHYALNPNGILVLGKSENLGIFHPGLFNLTDKNHSIFAKKESSLKHNLSFRLSPPRKSALKESRKMAPAPYEFDVNREIDRVLIERTGHAAVLVNESHDIIQTKGTVSAYFRLPSGRMSLNIMKMANDDLVFELKMLLQKSAKSADIQCKQIETDRGLTEVEVIPIHKPLVKEKYFLILLSPAKTNGFPLRKPGQESKRVAQLQQELIATKAWMQGLIEEHESNIQELKSVNEEVLSGNEELQSLNEELHTAKEELESTNEELTTLNEQLGHQMEALSQSEERFRILVDSIQDYAIFMLDPQGRIATWNRGAERLKGYKTQEIIGQHFSKFYPKEDRAKAAMELRTAIRKGFYREEGWRIRKDGSRIWARVVLTPVRSMTGKLKGFAKVTFDMSAQKAADEKLRQSEERFRLMVDAVQDYAIFMLDAKGYVVTWNIGAERLKLYKPNEIIGKHISTFYPKEDRRTQIPQKLMAHAVKHGRAVDEGWRVRKDGSRFWANVTITALKDKEGNLRGFSKVTRDMTERKKKEEELRYAYNALEEKVQERTRELQKYSEELMRSNADLQQFAYIASHDLQEPLRIVSIYADLLKRQLKDNSDLTVQNYFAFLQEGAQRAQRLIRELLEYSRIGTQGQTFVNVPIESVIKHVASLMDITISESKAKITHDHLPTLNVDRFQMEQLFQNLFTNAIKYRSSVPPVIHVSAQLRNEEWVFSVKDNGIGIEPQYKDLIFTVFKRLHSPQDYPGTGIGLALCKKIIERHGGKIWVESALGRGATFRFTLPVKRKKPQE
jgi:two-component system, chemotaxis family, CheB/CheR fusion protein